MTHAPLGLARGRPRHALPCLTPALAALVAALVATRVATLVATSAAPLAAAAAVSVATVAAALAAASPPLLPFRCPHLFRVISSLLLASSRLGRHAPPITLDRYLKRHFPSGERRAADHVNQIV